MLVSLALALGGILFLICSELGSITAYDTIQFPYINCNVAVCHLILRFSLVLAIESWLGLWAFACGYTSFASDRWGV